MKVKLTLAVSILLFGVVVFGTPFISRGVASGDNAPPAVVSSEQESPILPGLVAGEPCAQEEQAAAQDIPHNQNGVAAPQVCIPVPTDGNCCIWQLEKKFDGKRTAKYSNPYKCPVGVNPSPVTPTMQGTMTVTLTLASGGATCDPMSSLIPNNSVLTAQGRAIRRNDDFAHFYGRFTIASQTGATLFTGHIETIDRLGTHHLFSNCEACNPQSHFEGWLVGQGAGTLANYTIRALVSSRGTVPSPTTPSTPAVGSISGTLIRCP